MYRANHVSFRPIGNYFSRLSKCPEKKIQNAAQRLLPSRNTLAHLEEQVGKDKHTERNRDDRRQRHARMHNLLYCRLDLSCRRIRLFGRDTRRPLPQPRRLRRIRHRRCRRRRQLLLEPLNLPLCRRQWILIVALSERGGRCRWVLHER